jgi:hypothetical protein
MSNTARAFTMLGVAVSLMIVGFVQGAAERRALPAASDAQPQVRPAPTDADRTRLTELAARDKAWIARATADLVRTAEAERTRFLEGRRATLNERNARSRAQLSSRLRAADTPAARAEARRIEILTETADLVRRAETASAPERLEIERRAGQLGAELRRLPQ